MSETAKHTPGPWIFCGSHVDDYLGLPLVRSATSFENLNPLDLRLIAAAPDLLTACEHLIEEGFETISANDVGSPYFWADLESIAKVRAAIARATGASHA
jgi:hypothetical protein